MSLNMDEGATLVTDDGLQALHAERALLLQRIAELELERDSLRAAYERLQQELELIRRRLFVAKAERVDTAQLELEFGEVLRKLDALAGTLGIGRNESEVKPEDDAPGEPGQAEDKAADGKNRGGRKNNRGTGRRKVGLLALPEELIVLPDPYFEELVAQGKVSRHGFDETHKIMRQRGGKRRVVVKRVRYKACDSAGETDIITAAMPPDLLGATMATASLGAHVIMENIGKGMPLFRIEDSFERDGVPIDRGTLSRWKKRVGDGLASTVVEAMKEHAKATAFCIATDATGICIQPINNGAGRQPCKKAHFLVQVADRDHIIFDYLERETSVNISSVFRGFEGYVQADAKNVFDVLFADADTVRHNQPDIEVDGCTRLEVGCWYHMRRRYWEATVAKSRVAAEGLARIGRIFEVDASWQDKPPDEIKRLREQHLRPHVDSFFAWVEEQRPQFAGQRGYVRTALEYTHNHCNALKRFFDDGRLQLDNTRAERAIKGVALGRKAWLFCGSDDHAKSTAALFSILASARLHGIEPEEYLRCLIRLVPVWPKGRMIELSPLFWSRTRDRLDPGQLAVEVGWISIPAEPLDLAPAKQQPTS